jgi:hypothetical protein
MRSGLLGLLLTLTSFSHAVADVMDELKKDLGVMLVVDPALHQSGGEGMNVIGLYNSIRTELDSRRSVIFKQQKSSEKIAVF